MQAGRRYSLWQTLNWTRGSIVIFLLYDSMVVGLFYIFRWEWLIIPWQPISLIGIAVAFYLGFKNNSSYERLWEARKIWGGIVNTSRTFTIMARDFITNEHAKNTRTDAELKKIHTVLVHRHIAWLYALTFQLRKIQEWEHKSKDDIAFRKHLGLESDELKYTELKNYISNDDFKYIMSKGNRASHLLSLQSSHLLKLKLEGLIEDFRHMELEKLLGVMFDLQGKSERIKNFPFPRQYATANYFFVCLFIALLPFGMLNAFGVTDGSMLVWLAVPFSMIASWVFWMMESIGEYSENPFEGLYNDVPITSMTRSIEIDIRQMLDEINLPEPIQPKGEHKILI